MAYEYEKENIRKLKSYNVLSGGANITKPIDELQEVYSKAKAFDEILQVDNQATDEDRITGQYESDIETVLSEYMEHADDER